MKTRLSVALLAMTAAAGSVACQAAAPPRFNFVIAPGTDPRSLRLEYPDARRVEVDASGDLELQVGTQSVRLPRPDAYQEAGGARRQVPVQFTLDGGGYVTFTFGQYDGHLPLVVVPFNSQAGLR